MRSKILLPLVLLGGMTLVGCNQGGSKPGPVVTYGIEIANKQALQAEWHVKEAARELDINLTPAGNVMAALANGELTVESSAPTVVSVTGINLNAIGEGTATVTVTYHGVTDTVSLTVQAEKGEPDHVSATVADILKNVADGKEKDVIYDIEVYVVAWQSGKADATKYGNYMIADAAGEEDTSKQLLVYGSSANTEAFTITWSGSEYSYVQGDEAKDFLTNEVTKDVGIGSKLTMSVIAYKYNTTIEVSGIVKSADNSGVIHHDIPEPALVTGKTIAEFTADTQGNGKQLYELTGKVTKWKDDSTTDGTKYGNFYLADDSGEVYVYGATATATALSWSTDSGIYSFNNPKDFLTDELTKTIAIGSVVTIKLSRCDYNTTIEGNGIVTAVDNSGLTPTPVTPEPALVTGKTIAEFTADTQGNGKQLYELTGKVTKWKDDSTTDGTKYGNFYLADDSGEVYVYGATATATALVWSEENGKYSFTNPKDFLTNELTSQIKIGSTVTIKLSRCDYNTTIEGNGIVTAVEAGDPITLESIDLGEDFELEQGKTKQLKATLLPAGAEGEVVWSVEGNDKVTVEAGLVSVASDAVVGSEATVKATVGTVVGSVKVTVKAADQTDYSTMESAIAASSFTADAENAKLATYVDGIATYKLDQNESTTPNRLSDSDHLRVYKKAKFSVTLSSGPIKKVELTMTGASYAAVANFEQTGTVTVSDTVVTIELDNAAATLSFVAANQVRFNNVKIYYAA